MKEILFNTGWEYWESDNAFAFLEDRNAGNACPVTLPHDAMLEKPASDHSYNGYTTGHRDGGVYQYQKKLFVPEDWKEKTTILKFEGVYMNVFVYVNRQLAGKWHYGYSTSYVNLDSYLQYGAENEIRVMVKNDGLKNTRWYSGGGIYRDVYLVQSGLTYIPYNSLQVETEKISEADAVVKVGFAVQSRLYGAKKQTATIAITDDSGRIVAEEEITYLLYEGKEKRIQRRFRIEQPKLWSAETPNLYRVSVVLRDGQEILDEAEDSFGIRSISIDAVNGLRVNGQSVKLKGTCLHHDLGLLGAASYEEAHIRQMTLLKEAGFNAVRMSHHPMGQAMLRACDRVGMYVMDEAFDMWNISKNDGDYSLYFAEEWKFVIRSMAEKDYNHPSVILYSLGNEIPECTDERGAETSYEMARYLRQYDATRFVTEAVNGVFAAGNFMGQIVDDVAREMKEKTNTEVNDFMTIMRDHMDDIVSHPIISERLEYVDSGLDLLGYNYMGARYRLDKEKYPNRVIFGSETYPPAVCKEWDIIMDCPNNIGEFTWTGWDYIGEVGVGIPKYAPIEPMTETKYPNQLAYVGDIDITGFRKPMSYLRQKVYEKEVTPYIAVQDPVHYGDTFLPTPWMLSDAIRSWNWDGSEDKPVCVEVYSAAEEVELFINGVSFGRKPAGKAAGYRTLFDAVYQKGRVEAVSYVKGLETGRDCLVSAGKERRIVLEQEKNWGDALVFINVRCEDAEGITAADVNDEISVQVEGAELLGFGSGTFAPLHNFSDPTAELYHGRAQIVLRRSEKPAGLTITWKGEEQYLAIH
ncbi:MAG: glycoside hydrolase family 2 TIM barrel-domain containing protein [Lachnospiraceae bacterium]|nr:glycoside hydrolase family 2 TIM barrel-domain containing protein [Lachnospiraceae bacterium]